MLTAALALVLAASPRVAVTVDDLPFVGGVAPGDTKARAIARIVDVLRRHEVPAVGFVTCRNIDDAAPLAAWSGAELGNHTTRHKSVDALGVRGFVDDAVACGARIARETGRAPRFFRYPFLQTGKTADVRDEGARAIRAERMTIAPVSIDTSDWAFDDAYLDALRAHDAGRARDVVAAYLHHMDAAARRYRDIARERFGRDVDQVLLVHANAINADHLDDVLTGLERTGFTYVSLEDALRDPAYALADDYAGGIGMSWLYRAHTTDARIAPRTRWAWDDAQVAGVTLRFRGAAGGDVHIGDLTLRALDAHAFLVVDEKPWAANSLLLEFADGSTGLLSTPYDEAATRDLVDFVSAVWGAPPSFAVDSHFHFDGAGGNHALEAAGVPVYGSDLTVRMLRERGDAMKAQTLAYLDGDPATKARIEATPLTPPDHVFVASDGLVLERGGERVEVRFPGPAHAPDNVVVWLPARRLLFGGCMLLGQGRVVNKADADLARWPAALRAVRALVGTAPARIVPGHGAVTDDGLIERSIGFVDGTAR